MNEVADNQVPSPDVYLSLLSVAFPLPGTTENSPADMILL